MARDRISRREFLRHTAAAGGVGVFGRWSGPQPASAGRLVITDPGGDWQQAAVAAYYRPFEAETGIKVVYSARPALALGRLKAMVEAGNVDWDLTILADYLAHRGARDGLIEPIDYDLIDTTGVIPSARLSHLVGNDVFATVLAYNHRRWPAGQGPRTWADFWDVKRFPGRRSMSGIGYGPLEFALLADGVATDRLYPLDVDRALRKMDEIRPHVRVWWTTGAQMSQLLATNEVDLIQGWNARLQSAINRRAPFTIEWGQGMSQVEGWVIPKGARNRKDAHRFLDFVLRPKPQAEFAARLAYGPVNRQALAQLPPDIARRLPTFESNLSQLFIPDTRWIADNTDQLQQRWTAWKVG